MYQDRQRLAQTCPKFDRSLEQVFRSNENGKTTVKTNFLTLVGPHFFIVPHITMWGSCLSLCARRSETSSRPPSYTFTTYLTPPISHHPSDTTHLTPLILHHSTHTIYLTTPILHYSSYTTQLTPPILHYSSYTTHLTPLFSFMF